MNGVLTFARDRFRVVRQYLGLLGVLLLLVLCFATTSEHFLSTRTLTSIANQIPDLTVVAVGMTFVLLVGGIDLSVGSMLAMSAAVLGMAYADLAWPLWIAIVAACVASSCAGLLNGLVTVFGGIPSFIVTLGMLEVARGTAYLLTGSQTVFIGAEIEGFGSRLPPLPVSPAFLLSVAIVGIAQVVLNKTVFGRYCLAIGNNREAVRLSGIDPRPYVVAVFTLSGLLCGIGGFMQTSRLSAADPNTAIGLELAAIAAAVIGGTSLLGGRGSVINTFFGVLIIAVLQTGLAQNGVTEPVKRIVTGAVIIVAVLVDSRRTEISRRLMACLMSAVGR